MTLILVKWSCTNKKIKLMISLTFDRMLVYKCKNQINEDLNFRSNGRVQIKKNKLIRSLILRRMVVY